MKSFPAPEFTNPRGIPKAHFIENVDEFITNEEEAEVLIKQIQQMVQQYEFMELATANRIKGLQDKSPDFKKSLETTRFLKSQQESFTTHYELSDTVYSTAEIGPTETVYLWLGANVMLEYPLDEAETLLSEKLEGIEKSLSSCLEDLGFLRENITTMEVNMARVVNWKVAAVKK